MLPGVRGGRRASQKGDGKDLMVKSMQSAELGERWFSQLQEEVKEASDTTLQEFQDVLDPDAMGPDGKEGIDDAD